MINFPFHWQKASNSRSADESMSKYEERTKQMEPILRAKVKIFFKSENLI